MVPLARLERWAAASRFLTVAHVAANAPSRRFSEGSPQPSVIASAPNNLVPGCHFCVFRPVARLAIEGIRCKLAAKPAHWPPLPQSRWGRNSSILEGCFAR